MLSSEPYSCGGIESVPAIQKISVTLLADTRNTLVSIYNQYICPFQYRRSWDWRCSVTAVLGGSITLKTPIWDLKWAAVLGGRRYWEGGGIGRDDCIMFPLKITICCNDSFQILQVPLKKGDDNGVLQVSMFCMEPESKYTVRIVGERITQPVVIQEVGLHLLYVYIAYF